MEFLLDLALVLISAKVFGELFERIGMPELLGAILAGFVLGPVLGIVDITNIAGFGQVGLILLLFVAGFSEVDIAQMKKNKKAALLVGIFGSLIPLAVGYYLAQAFGFDVSASLFIGLALAATSISISLGAFIEAGKLNTRAGRTILGASVIDDILGLLLLAVVMAIATTGGFPSVGRWFEILLGMGAFGVLFVLGGMFFPILLQYSKKFEADEAQFSIVVVLIMLLSFFADKVGLSTVLGAFLAGVLLSRVPQLGTRRFLEKIGVVSEGIFIPFFFAWIGLQIVIDPAAISMFTLFLILLAILTKFIGAYVAAALAGLKQQECTILGIGMIPRGEVALVVLMLGVSIGAVPQSVFSSFMILIFVTVFLTPLLISPLLKHRLPG